MSNRLTTDKVTKIYSGRKVVDEVSLDINEGEIVGLLGPNGAGKTTTFHMVVGLTKPDGGKVYLNEQDLTGIPVYMRARKGIGYLAQEPSVFKKLSVKNNMKAIAETQRKNGNMEDRIETLLEDFGLNSLSERKAFSLSGGERRRLEIARALILSPSFLLLDEPFSGIDPIAVIEIQNIIEKLRKKDIGILITDHNVRETLSITDRAYIIRQGSVFRADTPENLARDSEVRRIYLGENFSLD